MKCWPFFFNSRNWVNLFVACSGGDPGGEAGISKLGTAGRVRFWIRARFEVYGEPGGPSSDCPASVGGGETVGPCDGPFIGPETVGVSSSGVCLEAYFVGGAFAVAMLVNLILVAIKALLGRL